MLFVFLTASLFAYEKGDMLDKEIQKDLGLKNDKVYIIDFFASWCGSCKKEIPLISKANMVLDAKSVEIIGVDVDKDAQKAAVFQKQLKSNHTLNFRVVNDVDNHIIHAFNPIGMPALYYVKNGRVENIIFGAVDDIDKKIITDMEKL